MSSAFVKSWLFCTICPPNATFHLLSTHNHCSKRDTNYFVVIIVGEQEYNHLIKLLFHCFSVLTPLNLRESEGSDSDRPSLALTCRDTNLVRIKSGRNSNWFDGQFAIFETKNLEEIFWIGKWNLHFSNTLFREFQYELWDSLPSEQEVEQSFPCFIPTKKQTNKQTIFGSSRLDVWNKQFLKSQKWPEFTCKTCSKVCSRFHFTREIALNDEYLRQFFPDCKVFWITLKPLLRCY